MSAQTNVCNICCDTFSKCVRLPIPCPYCQFQACKQCCQTYLLQETMPHCMNSECGREWSRQFIRKTFSQVFINKSLKDHREIVLFDQERALLPATQPLVERQIQREQLNTEYNDLRRQMNELRRQSSDVLRRQYQLEHGEDAAGPERASFVRACPDATCRGFLSSQWKCGLCEQWTCNLCHEIKGRIRDVEHTCDPNNVATAELLNRDTKPCPSCGMGIFRIEGCSQMYCTACNTAFDWRTAQIVTTAIHNPHYFEYMRRTGHAEGEEGAPLAAQQPQQPQQHQCGRDINHQFVRRNYELMSAKLEPRGISQNTVHSQYRVQVDKFCSIARGVIHVRLVELPQYRYNHAQNNEILRIQYMRNRINEEDFKRKLQMQNKKHQKNLEISQVCQMVINTITDILYRFQHEINETTWNGLPQDQNSVALQDIGLEHQETNMFKTLDECDRIIDYANECMRDISNTYDSVKLQFNHKFELR